MKFRYPGAPRAFAGDSFYVVDVEQRRVSFFDGRAQPTVTRRWPLQLGESVLFPIGMVSSEQFVATLVTNRHASRIGERFRTPVRVVTGRFAAADFDTIARGRGDERVGGLWREAGQEAVVSYRVAFGSTTQVAFNDGLVYLGESASPRIGIFDLAGRPVRTIAWETALDPVTEADRRARVTQESTAIAGVPTTDLAQLWSAVEHLRTAKLPKHAPVFTALLPSSDGSIWVELDPRPWLSGRQYLVFDSVGTPAARVALPRQLEPYQVDTALVLGRWHEPGEGDQVRLYRIARRKR